MGSICKAPSQKPWIAMQQATGVSQIAKLCTVRAPWLNLFDFRTNGGSVI